MVTMFKGLLNSDDSLRYRVLNDQLYTGGEELLTSEFMNILIEEARAQYFIYIVGRINGGMCKARFLVFETLGSRLLFIYENKGNGYAMIDETALALLN